MPGACGWPCLDLLGARVPDAGRLLFVDLETTGLAGGAGTLAFLVGCAWFDGASFRIRQFFLSSFGAEAELLDGVARLAADAAAVVTYNGKSFDLPLLETRFAMHRRETPFAGLPHVDMLHPARRLWKETAGDVTGVGSSADTGCRLTALERTHCGVTREGDVPGFEIPSRYFGYVRSGDARPLEAVIEHNRLDLMSLALLTSRAAELLDRGASGASTAREALGMGRLYERGGLADQARACYARAADIAADPHRTDLDSTVGATAPPGDLTVDVTVDVTVDATHAPTCDASPLPGDATTRGEALRAYAIACRRGGLCADAAVAWARILDLGGCPAQIVREATEALAIHHEHRLRDPGAARAFALRSLRFEASLSRQQALHHRLARLDRKLGSVTADATGDATRAAATPPLFSA